LLVARGGEQGAGSLEGDVPICQRADRWHSAARGKLEADEHCALREKAPKWRLFFFLSPYYQDTKCSDKVGQSCWGAGAGK
jgi:hypothetical protein